MLDGRAQLRPADPPILPPLVFPLTFWVIPIPGQATPWGKDQFAPLSPQTPSLLLLPRIGVLRDGNRPWVIDRVRIWGSSAAPPPSFIVLTSHFSNSFFQVPCAFGDVFCVSRVIVLFGVLHSDPLSLSCVSIPKSGFFDFFLQIYLRKKTHLHRRRPCKLSPHLSWIHFSSPVSFIIPCCCCRDLSGENKG